MFVYSSFAWFTAQTHSDLSQTILHSFWNELLSSSPLRSQLSSDWLPLVQRGFKHQLTRITSTNGDINFQSVVIFNESPPELSLYFKVYQPTSPTHTSFTPRLLSCVFINIMTGCCSPPCPFPRYPTVDTGTKHPLSLLDNGTLQPPVHSLSPLPLPLPDPPPDRPIPTPSTRHTQLHRMRPRTERKEEEEEEIHFT